MDIDWQIQGHKRQLAFLQHAAEVGRLPHGLLFAGPSGVGKRTVAMKLAEALLGEQTGSFNPDLIVVERMPDKSEIVIEQIRDLVYKLALKPYAAPYKVAVIDDASQLNEEAANAMLKSLEEPKDYTIIILITSNPSRLPKTIVSRTQKINFGLVPGFEQQPLVDDKHETFMSNSLVDRLLLAAELAELETEEIKNILQSWLMRLSRQLHDKPDLKLKEHIERVSDSMIFLEQNANAKLLLTNLMLNT